MINDDTTTVGELVELIRRQKAAVSEAGHPEIAENAHIVIEESGRVLLSYDPYESDVEYREHWATTKAIGLDPIFEKSAS